MLNNGTILYSENDSVFYYNPDQKKFGLLYDYTVDVGDTVELIVPAGSFSNDTTFKIKIDSIAMQVYPNDTVIRFYNTSLHPDYHFYNSVYMTRIGAYNILPDIGISIPERDYLKCYIDYSLYINYSGIPCDSLAKGVTENIAQQTKVNIFPNPTKSTFNLEIKENLNILEITLYNLLGEKIKNYNPNERTLSVKGIRNGQYLLKIQADNQVITKRVLVE